MTPIQHTIWKSLFFIKLSSYTLSHAFSSEDTVVLSQKRYVLNWLLKSNLSIYLTIEKKNRPSFLNTNNNQIAFFWFVILIVQVRRSHRTKSLFEKIRIGHKCCRSLTFGLCCSCDYASPSKLFLFLFFLKRWDTFTHKLSV